MNNEAMVDEYIKNNKSQCDKCSRLLVVQYKENGFYYPCSINSSFINTIIANNMI